MASHLKRRTRRRLKSKRNKSRRFRKIRRGGTDYDLKKLSDIELNELFNSKRIQFNDLSYIVGQIISLKKDITHNGVTHRKENINSYAPEYHKLKNETDDLFNELVRRRHVANRSNP